MSMIEVLICIITYVVGVGVVIGLLGDDIETIYAAALWPIYLMVFAGILLGEWIKRYLMEIHREP